MTPTEGAAVPTLAVVLEGEGQPRWVVRLLARLEERGHPVIGFVVPTAPRHELRALRRVVARVDRDRHRNRSADSPVEPVDLAQLRPDLVRTDRPADAIREARRGTDVILWVGESPPPDGLTGLARAGVWQIRVRAAEMDAPLGLWEPLLGRPTTTVRIRRHHPDPTLDGTLAAAAVRTDPYSPSTTQLRAAEKLESLLMARLDELAGAGEPDLDDRPDPPGLRSKPVDGTPTSEPADATPTPEPSVPGMALLAGAARIAAVRVRDRVRRRLGDDRWVLGYRFGEAEPDAPGRGRFEPIPAPEGTFWADPFPVLHDGRPFVFFEEYVRATGRGRISVIELGPDGPVGPARVVLEADHHLSYPFIFPHDDSLFMVPESMDARTTVLYRCEGFPDRWAPVAELLPGHRLVDPTLLHHDGHWWLFASRGGPADCQELHLFHADALTGPWQPHRHNPVVDSPGRARPAGRLFHRDGSLYRPSQCCVPRYGSAVVVSRVTELSTAAYRESEVGRLAPWHGAIEGCHTLNFGAGLTVTDGRISPFRRLGSRARATC